MMVTRSIFGSSRQKEILDFRLFLTTLFFNILVAYKTKVILFIIAHVYDTSPLEGKVFISVKTFLQFVYFQFRGTHFNLIICLQYSYHYKKQNIKIISSIDINLIG